MGNGITNCYPDEVGKFISITVLTPPGPTSPPPFNNGRVVGRARAALEEHVERVGPFHHRDGISTLQHVRVSGSGVVDRLLATSGRPHSRRRWSLVITSRPPAGVPAVANPSSPDGVTQACRRASAATGAQPSSARAHGTPARRSSPHFGR